MSVKVNIEQLRSFEKPLLASNEAYVAVLLAQKACQEAIGEGTGIDESFERNGIALEKTYNEEVITAAKTAIDTLTASADNAEEVRKVMATFGAVETGAVAAVEVKQGVRPAAFSRN